MWPPHRCETRSNSRSGRSCAISWGAGLITGASDDDPGGIATYSQAGAQFGYRLGAKRRDADSTSCTIRPGFRTENRAKT
jgi:hypothetical protein